MALHSQNKPQWGRLVWPLELAIVLLLLCVVLLSWGNAAIVNNYTGKAGYHTAVSPHVDPEIYSGIGPTPELDRYDYKPLVNPRRPLLYVEYDYTVSKDRRPAWWGQQWLP